MHFIESGIGDKDEVGLILQSNKNMRNLAIIILENKDSIETIESLRQSPGSLR